MPPVLAPPAALPAERRVLARRGWAGEKAAFLSILRGLPFIEYADAVMTMLERPETISIVMSLKAYARQGVLLACVV